MPICLKCQKLFIIKIKHRYIKKYCSSFCAYSRGPRSAATKRKISLQIRETTQHYPKCKVKYSKVTGMVVHPDIQKRHFWDSHAKNSFAKKLCNWFDIPMADYPSTINQLNLIQEKVFELYHIKNMSSLEIRDYLNLALPDGHCPAFIKQLGITRRTLSESIINSFYTGRSNIITGKSKYKTGYHINWKNESIWYRSSYELEFYKYLDYKKKHYYVENVRIKYYDSQQAKFRIAIPDIRIGRMLIEIKSKGSHNKTNIFDKFSAYINLGFKPILVYEHKVYRFGALDRI